MNLIAATGLKVPMEGKPHDYITDTKGVVVPDSAYYQRRITDGDLIEVKATVKTTAAARAVPQN